MQHASPITLQDLQRKADTKADFDGLGDNNDYGQFFFTEEREVRDTDYGTESKTLAADCIGAVVLGDDDGDFAAPVVLTHDEACARFGVLAVAVAEDIQAQPCGW